MLRSLSWLGINILPLLLLFSGCSKASPTPPSANESANNHAESSWTDPASIAYEPLPQHGRIELSNLQIRDGLGGAQTFSVDWKVTSGEPYGTMLVVKPTGSPQTLEIGVTLWPGEKSGTVTGSVESYGGGSSGSSLASGCEVYMVTLEGESRHKISNSLTTGGMPTTNTRPASEVPTAKTSIPADENLADLPADVDVSVGTKLKIVSDGRLASVTVVESFPDGNLRIKWDDGDFSGVFPRSSLKIDAKVLATLARQEGGKAPSKVPAPTFASDAKLSEIPADIVLPTGTPLRALYAGQWKPVTLLARESEDKVKIHWDGFSDSWDEVKPLSELRIEASRLDALRQEPPNEKANSASSPKVDVGGRTEGRSEGEITSSTQLEVGQKLEAEWAGRWLPVTVKSTRPDGTVEVHWEGYSDNFDEAVPRSRLRLRAGK